MLHITRGLTVYILSMTALLGLVMGSFLNCWAYRLSREESVVKGRSRCPACGHELGVPDLIPVLSYVFLRGQCRYCKQRLAPRYILAELLCATYFLSVVWHFDVSLKALQYLILGSLLFCAALVDLESQIIPDRLIAGAIVNFVVFAFLGEGAVLPTLWKGLLAGLSISLPLLVIVLIMDQVLKRESMGGGDIKLFFAIGLYFTWQHNLLLLISSSLVGLVFAVTQLGYRNEEENPGAFPFGPAIILAYWGLLLWGDYVVDWYQSLFMFG